MQQNQITKDAARDAGQTFAQLNEEQRREAIRMSEANGRKNCIGLRFLLTDGKISAIIAVTTNASAATTAQETDEQIISKHDPSCRKRARVELAIIHRVIRDLKAAGYSVKVNDGEETITGTEQELVNAVFGVDEANILTAKEGCKNSFVFLVLGNDGWDAISDYGVSLEPIMEPISQWIDAQLDAGKF